MRSDGSSSYSSSSESSSSSSESRRSVRVSGSRSPSRVSLGGDESLGGDYETKKTQLRSAGK